MLANRMAFLIGKSTGRGRSGSMRLIVVLFCLPLLAIGAEAECEFRLDLLTTMDE